jgi:hypothetical protein
MKILYYFDPNIVYKDKDFGQNIWDKVTRELLWGTY